MFSLSSDQDFRYSPYQIYLFVISALGLVLIGWGLGEVWQNASWTIFSLLCLLAIVAVLMTTSISVGKSSITYAVDAVLGFTAIAVLGIGSAIVIHAIATSAVWLIKPHDRHTWKKSFAQLCFNQGMVSISVFVAGTIYYWLAAYLGNAPLLGAVLPWIPAAIAYEQINLWLLIAILYLQNGQPIAPWQVFREEWPTTQLLVITYTIGATILVYAIENYDALGVIIFFLPILLSAYAIRLYVGQMKAHMDNLEQIVADRTMELTARTKQLSQRTEELEQVNKNKDAFLAVLTHDMMTPLSNIRYCADMLRLESEAGTSSQKMSELILRSQGTLFNMVRNIVDIETVRNGEHFAINRVKCDITQLISTVVETMQPAARDKEINLQLVMDELPELRVDGQHMERILNNLLSNALKYTKKGGSVWLSATIIDEATAVVEQTAVEKQASVEEQIPAEEQTSVEEQVTADEWLHISVEDTGFGIAESELETIFEHYNRSAAHQDKAVGAGLGLAITKALVEGHDGTISVQSEVGVGSVFSVRIPIYD